MNLLKTLFQYLDVENIPMDKEEFEFQFNSHPDYPSLLALSDTLKFFNVNNGAFKIEKSEIDLLPNSFIARLKNGHTDYLSFVEKKENIYIYTNETEKKHSALKEDFETLWGDVVLLAENDIDVSKSKQQNKVTFLFPLFSIILFLAVLSINLINKWFLAFYVFPIIGAFFSIAALKDLFNTRSELLDKFCNTTIDSSCKTVVNSSKWKVFETISFSDLSILFFTIQISSLFLMDISGNQLDYFYMQTMLLILSVPIIVASLYYQKFIEKKWCPICLTIMGVLLLELGYVIYLNSFLNLTLSLYGVLLFLLVSSIMTAVWFPLKKILTKVNQLKNVELKANRFKRNYTIFKNTLLSTKKLKLPSSPLTFGDQDSQLEISIITSPFCSYCKEPHYLLKSILENYTDSVKISTIFNVHPKIEDLKKITMSLIEIQICQGEAFYYQAMDEWYNNKDREKWLEKFQINSGNHKIERFLKNQHEWCVNNDFNFTPCVFINGYEYPKSYEISDLPF
ncbi:MAG TPA: vitamin K epoxide reductase family protein, partial [Gelidibacter sp.]|uniref:vitamin K epoxide reductase family protein n=1 Tax=Gelidibacter sp. TaxID=2018083 RepID=UPI002B894ADA